MTVAVPARSARAPRLRAALARTFEAVVFDWDGTAVADRAADASRLRELVQELCVLGLELVVITGTQVGNVDGQLRARPSGPGHLHLCVNRGSEVFRADEVGLHLIERREATADEEAVLDAAAEAIVAALAARGLRTAIVSRRLNRRKIDLIPEPAWSDPPKARIAELAAAVEGRLRRASFSGIDEAVDLARRAAREAGLAHPRVTSDAKHVEIGLTDKSDAARWVFAYLKRRGIPPELVLVAGDEFGSLGGLPGSDALLLAGEAVDAAVVSVGAEPTGVPPGVIALGGGPDRFLELLADQVERQLRAGPRTPCRAAPDRVRARRPVRNLRQITDRRSADTPMRRSPDRATLSSSTNGGVMWANGLLDWMILGSGYVLALVVFSLLGGLPRAGEAIQRWGKRTTSRVPRRTPAP